LYQFWLLRVLSFCILFCFYDVLFSVD
jgi:hypothetical protein